MKKIQSFQIWVNGSLKTASWFNVISISDNLENAANFYWQLFENIEETEIAGQQIAEGNLAIGGEDYVNWNDQPDVNAWAYSWVADQLGIILI